MAKERTEEEIDQCLDLISESIDEGYSNFPGMTYEEGVKAAILWVTGETDEHPTEE